MCSIAKRKIIILMRKVRLSVKFKNFAFRKPHLGYLTLKTVALTLTDHKLQIPLLTLIQTCDACSASPSLCTTSRKARLHQWIGGKPAGEPETTHVAHATTTTVTVTRQQQLLQSRLTSTLPRPVWQRTVRRLYSLALLLYN